MQLFKKFRFEFKCHQKSPGASHLHCIILSMYYTYIDYTNEARPFYVGMGLENRIQRNFDRNPRHTNTGKKHGLNRRIVGSFDNRQNAIDLEIQLIAEHHTFVDDPEYNGIGCNYTKGGEGCACSEETRKKISDSRKGRPPWNKGKSVSYNISLEERKRRADQLSKRNRTETPWLGKKHSDETRSKMRKPHRCSNCQEIGHTKTTCRAQKLPSAT